MKLSPNDVVLYAAVEPRPHGTPAFMAMFAPRGWIDVRTRFHGDTADEARGKAERWLISEYSRHDQEKAEAADRRAEVEGARP